MPEVQWTSGRPCRRETTGRRTSTSRDRTDFCKGRAGTSFAEAGRVEHHSGGSIRPRSARCPTLSRFWRKGGSVEIQAGGRRPDLDCRPLVDSHWTRFSQGIPAEAAPWPLLRHQSPFHRVAAGAEAGRGELHRSCARWARGVLSPAYPALTCRAGVGLLPISTRLADARLPQGRFGGAGACSLFFRSWRVTFFSKSKSPP
jgi:hypothetical protein